MAEARVAVNAEEIAAKIWRQEAIPVIYRPGRGKLMVRMAYAPDNRLQLRHDRQRRPRWDKLHRCWLIPAAWFDQVVAETLCRFGKLYVIQPYREMEKCARACWEAKGFHCECSCMGANHGTETPDGQWFEVSETCAIQWRGRRLAYRLLEMR